MTWFRVLLCGLVVSCALLLVGLVVISYQLHNANGKIDANTAKIQRNGRRSCEAIHGASAFWKIVRKATEAEINDPGTNEATRAADQHFVVALNRVITLADSLPCDNG